jgi:hypothetical protein
MGSLNLPEAQGVKLRVKFGAGKIVVTAVIVVSYE